MSRATSMHHRLGKALTTSLTAAVNMAHTNTPITRAALIVTIAAFIMLLGNRHYLQTDLTATSRHTLLPQSIQVLSLFDSPGTTTSGAGVNPDHSSAIEVEVYISPNDEQRSLIERLLQKYARHNPDFSIEFIDPALNPTETRALNIAPGGEIIFRYHERTQRITQISETAITTALQRLAREKTRIASFVTGHGERSVSSQNGGDIGIISSQLASAGFVIKILI